MQAKPAARAVPARPASSKQQAKPAPADEAPKKKKSGGLFGGLFSQDTVMADRSAGDF